ncbi:family 43 glycosylhydrolase [Streptomyces sp. MUM 178J]|uniref:family 43 glycosylhydrolase n=1 Tax=Streptomyces sp. MUM 178J TaxID=2791991 RepID=UPI001F044E09|nr:family 43 glycosylhydrolase [Streptomyces sp. MUM 178J]WRQ80873.1 family 43 glycosylhydrolase [Streptomyces sp. MUM 178J]
MPYRRGRLLPVLLAVLIAAAGPAAADPAATNAAAANPAAASAPAVVVDGPVLGRNFPDPDVVKIGDTYHAYATSTVGRNIQHATSRDLVNWTLAASDPLPALGAWVDNGRRRVWAPDVFDNGDGYTMHYTAHDRASGKQCIGTALASSPDGPFRPVGDAPLICPVGQGGAIDAAGYTENGRRYMLWKSDGNCCGMDAWIHLQPVSGDGTLTSGRAVRLLRQELPWEGGVVEAPTLIRRDGRYILFYSAGSYEGYGYATGYAVADRLTGPYTKTAEPLMSTESFAGAVRGPGGQDLVTGPDGRDRIVFHGWNADRSQRFMYAADLVFADGRPFVRGSAVRYQAEDARLHRAQVREAAGALGGRAVAYIDHDDSSVEFRAFAVSAGVHPLSVRYGNGSLDEGRPAGASHNLSVNGEDAGVVLYPYTGWDTWRYARRPVVLAAGWNTIRLSKGERHAELDCLEAG